jgi:hypothetical protein
MVSKITGGDTQFLFSAEILKKYNIKYYRCKDTGFIQTESPFWLTEAYSSAITSLDLGLLKRNIYYSEKVEKVIFNHFNCDATFLDYAGGYGTFTRLMRDKGFNFYHTDKFCENLFAKHFELGDLEDGHQFELLTAFELFEHLVNPLEEITKMLNYSDSILFSTELVPQSTLQTVDDWWYFSQETGQHISFYTLESLEYIAKQIGCNVYSNGSALHLLTKRTFKENPLDESKKDPFLIRKLKKLLLELQPAQERTSLLQQDWEQIKRLINTSEY